MLHGQLWAKTATWTSTSSTGFAICQPFLTKVLSIVYIVDLIDFLNIIYTVLSLFGFDAL